MSVTIIPLQEPVHLQHVRDVGVDAAPATSSAPKKKSISPTPDLQGQLDHGDHETRIEYIRIEVSIEVCRRILTIACFWTKTI